MYPISIKSFYVTLRQPGVKYVKMPQNFSEHQNSTFKNLNNEMLFSIQFKFEKLWELGELKFVLWVLFVCYLFPWSAVLFVCFFVWSVVHNRLHMSCDLLRQAGLCWKKGKNRRVCPLLLLQLLLYFLFYVTMTFLIVVVEVDLL